MSHVLVRSMQGIGDTIYSRPFVKMLIQDGHAVYLKTVLPELFSDLPVKFIDPGLSDYRTQKKAQLTSTVKYASRNKFDREINPFYGHAELKRHGIVAHTELAFGYEAGSTKPIFDLPRFHVKLPYEQIKGKKIAVIKPVTLRKEWLCSSRAPEPEYVGWCSRMLRDSGYFVISIADCEEGEEWLDGSEPFAHLKLHKGELGLTGTLGLLQNTSIAVGGSGFIIPAAIAAKTNLFVVFGGRGRYDNPHKVFDLRMNMKKIGWALPTSFCRCSAMEHDCDKTIKDLDSQFYRFMGSIS